MSKKNNFGRAMYDIFGVGKDGESEEEELGGEETPAEGLYPRREAPAFASGAQDEEEPPVDDYRVEKAIPVHTFGGTYLAAGTMMHGTLTSRGDVEIAGDFEGEIVAKGKVTIHANITSKITATGLALVGCNLVGDVEVSGDVTLDSQSYIVGNVRAENMICSGKIKGDLDIQDNLVLDGSAQIDGSINADTMSVDRGAKITGSIEMRNIRA